MDTNNTHRYMLSLNVFVSLGIFTQFNDNNECVRLFFLVIKQKKKTNQNWKRGKWMNGLNKFFGWLISHWTNVVLKLYEMMANKSFGWAYFYHWFKKIIVMKLDWKIVSNKMVKLVMSADCFIILNNFYKIHSSSLDLPSHKYNR